MAGALDPAIEVEDAVVSQFIVTGAVTIRDLADGDEAPAALEKDCEAGIAVEWSWLPPRTGSSAAGRWVWTWTAVVCTQDRSRADRHCVAKECVLGDLVAEDEIEQVRREARESLGERVAGAERERVGERVVDVDVAQGARTAARRRRAWRRDPCGLQRDGDRALADVALVRVVSDPQDADGRAQRARCRALVGEQPPVERVEGGNQKLVDAAELLARELLGAVMAQTKWMGARDGRPRRPPWISSAFPPRALEEHVER